MTKKPLTNEEKIAALEECGRLLLESRKTLDDAVVTLLKYCYTQASDENIQKQWEIYKRATNVFMSASTMLGNLSGLMGVATILNTKEVDGPGSVKATFIKAGTSTQLLPTKPTPTGKVN